MGGTDLLLDWLDEELRYLGRPELVPRKCSLASWHDEEANGMREIIDRQSVCTESQKRTRRES